MKTDLDSYIIRFDNVLSSEDCDNIVSSLEKAKWDTHTFYSKESGYYHNSNEPQTCSEQIEQSAFIMDKVWQNIGNYCRTLKFPWFTGWNGHSPLKFNKYNESTKMENHCDHIHTIFQNTVSGIPILTALGSLNDSYDGGELVFFNDKVYPFPKGSIILFPSCFLYPHKVTPVNNGVRYSYVSWVY